MRHYSKILSCFLMLALFLSISYAHETAENTEKSSATDLIYEKAKECTVRIVGFAFRGSELGFAGGTGFFIAPDKIVTNFHVAAGITSGPITAKLMHKETIWLVEGVVAFNVKSDIAILEVTGEGVPLTMGDIDSLKIGDSVFLTGYPSPGREFKVAEGTVEDIRSSDKWIKTTLEAYPGNSGSPMLNSKGEIVGIHVGHGYDARPSSAIKALLENSTSTEPLAEWRQRKIVRAHAYYMQGWHQYYYGGNTEQAIEDFNHAIELNPDDLQIYKIRGDAKSKIGDYKGAIEDYNHVLKLNPGDPEIHKKLEEIEPLIKVQAREDGTVVRRTITRTSIISEPFSGDVSNYKELGHKKSEKGDYTGAIEDFTQAIKLKSDDVDAYKSRGWAKENIDDYVGAIEDYTEAIKIKPNDPNAYRYRGWAKRKSGDNDGAIEDFTKAIKLKPDDFQALISRATVKEIVSEYTGAIEDFTQAIKHHPQDATVYIQRAQVRLKVKDFIGAIADYDQALILKPEDSYFILNGRGLAKMKNDDHVRAIEDFNEVIKLQPNDTHGYNNRGLAKRKLGDYDAAIEDYTQAIKLKPDEPYSYRFRGQVKVELEDYTGAIQDYTQAIILNSEHSFGTYFAYIDRGNAKHKSKDFDGAIEDYNHAIMLKPKKANPYIDRGLAKVELKDFDGAIADYDKAIELNPKLAIAYHNRGLAKEALGLHKAAKVDFEKAKEIDPNLGQ